MSDEQKMNSPEYMGYQVTPEIMELRKKQPIQGPSQQDYCSVCFKKVWCRYAMVGKKKSAVCGEQQCREKILKRKKDYDDAAFC